MPKLISSSIKRIKRVTNNNELYHYGALGMKWGVHKGRVTATGARQMNGYYTVK